MSKPYKVEIVGDVGKLIMATKDSEKALEAVSDSLESVADGSVDIEKKMSDAFQDTAKTADKTADKVEKSFKEVDKSADKSADKASDSFKDAFDEIVADSRKTSDKVNDNQERMSEITEEVGSEMAQNFGSTMASFDGSAQSAVDIIADSFGGLAASMGIGGPIGTIILGAAAGVVSYFGTAWVEEFENIKTKQAEMYQQMLENTNAYFNDEQIAEAFNKIMGGAEDALIDENTLNQYVRATKMSAQDIAYAFADTRSEQAKQLRKIMDDAQAEYEEILSSGKISGVDPYKSIKQRAQEAAGYNEKLHETFKELSDQVEDTSKEVIDNTEYLRKQGHGAKEAADQAKAYIEAQNNTADALDNARTSIEENIKKHKDANDAYLENQGVLADLTDAMLNEQAAAEEAGESAEVLTDLQYRQAEAFFEAAKKAKISQEEAVELAHKFGLIPKEVYTDIKNKGVKKALDDAKKVRDELNKQPKKVSTTLEVKPDHAQANTAITMLERSLRNISIIGNVRMNRTAV